VISWAQLTTATTPTAILVRLLAFAKAMKLPTMSWGPKNFLLAAFQIFALVLGEQFGTVIVAIAKSGFRTQALGDWLTLIAKEFYGVDRNPATFTVVSATLANAGASPQTVAAGDLYLEALGGLLYRNTAGGTIAAGGTLTLSWQAEHAGIGYNLGGEALIGLTTPIVGVSVSALPGDGWLVTQGEDEEIDEDLAERCGERWATVGTAGAIEAYRFNALAAAEELGLDVTRARFYEESPAPGWVTGYLAGPSAPVSVATAAAVRTWFEDNAKRPGCVGLLLYPADGRNVTLTGTVLVKAAQLTAARTAIAEGLLALATATDFGGEIDVEELVALVRTAPGVTRLTLTTPAALITLAPSEVVTFVDALTYTAV